MFILLLLPSEIILYTHHYFDRHTNAIALIFIHFMILVNLPCFHMQSCLGQSYLDALHVDDAPKMKS